MPEKQPCPQHTKDPTKPWITQKTHAYKYDSSTAMENENGEPPTMRGSASGHQ